jgi:uncharacterized protein YggE
MKEIFESGVVKWAVIVLIVFLGLLSFSTLLNLRYIGAGIAATNTISVTGHGEVFAAPDIATFTFSVVSDKSTVAAAQADATTNANAITDYLVAQGVAKADIQTTNYSINPTYTYENGVCPQPVTTNSGGVSSGTAVYCPQGKQVLTGYEVDQSDTVKVRDTSKAGDLLAGVGSKGATNVSGLNFTFDNPDAVQNQARTAAIDDAKQKAQTLASELGVSLVRVTSFNESSSGTPGPRPYAMDATASGSTAAVAPDISVGQNDITDDVTITYEIR